MKYTWLARVKGQQQSLPAWGAWVEIIYTADLLEFATGRSPHGERGLKWICVNVAAPIGGRSPHGERGLKFELHYGSMAACRRSPHGERGLKSESQVRNLDYVESLPAWGAWVEIELNGQIKQAEDVAPRMGSVG